MNMEFTLRLPKDINDIKLHTYQKWHKIYEANKDATDNNFLEIKMLEIFCGLTSKEAALVPYQEAQKAVNHIVDVLQEETPLTDRWSITGSDGVTVDFGFIPNLSKISLGEYIDLDTYITDIDELNRAMAVLYRQVHESWKDKKAYRIAEYEGSDLLADVMKEMPLGIALGAMVFFYRLEMKLLEHSMLSLAQAAQTMGVNSEEERRHFQSVMDGIKAYTLLRKEMPYALNQLHGLKLSLP
jgi:hypothetical protein